MKHVFIINPVSGKMNAGMALVPEIKKISAKCGIVPELVYTKRKRHAVEIAAGFASKGTNVRLYAVGGDGTLNEVICGAYPFKNAQVASVPCGSGNDFVRSFGTPEDFLNLENNILGQAVLIDLMRVPPKGDKEEWLQKSSVCVSITSIGLDADVAYNIPKYRRVPFLGGTAAYGISVLEKMLQPLGKNLRIEIDGEEMQGNYLISTVCNGQTYGGGFRAAPMAKLNDGFLDVILVKKIGRLRVAKIIGNYKKGLHFANGKLAPDFEDIMFYCKAKKVVMMPKNEETQFIVNIDGECEAAPELSAEIMPLAATFVLPMGLENTEVLQKNN